ncbi:MAG: hypothetical protein WD895_09330 [Acidimicrobiia bacterium]
MHDHDLDLIASLADGSLDDQTQARALVETCQECRQEYEAQVTVIAAIATIESVRMTELERAALHRDLWTEVRSEPTKKPSATPWWYRLPYAAAGLFVMVGLVAVVNQLGTEVSETLSEVSSGLDGGADAQGEEPMNPAAFDEGAAENASSTTIAAAGETTVVTSAEFKALASETRLQQLPATVRAAPSDDQSACLTDAGLEDHELVGIVDNGRTYLIVIPAGVDLDTDTPVSFVDADTCEVVHVEE